MDPEVLAEFVAEKARKDPSVKKKLEIVRRLDGLREDARYQYLLEIVRENQKRFLTRLTKRLMSGDAVDQREIDFMRGYYRGAFDVAERPESSVDDLERAARHAYVTAELELTEQEGESPYE